MPSTLQQTTSSLKWSALSQVSRILTQLLSLLILARLLPPSDFGLAAMAMIVVGFASLFRDFGTAAAIIQTVNPGFRLINSVFWLNVSLGVLMALAVGLLAPIIAVVFAEPRLTDVLWMFLLTFPIASLGTVHQALLEKESQFRPLALVESVASFAGLLGAVWAAWSGWGVFSLVLQTLLTAFFSTVGIWLICQWRPIFQWDAKELLGLLRFSSNLVGFNLVNYFIRNADKMLIGRFLGATDLGYYSIAYRLMLWPLQNISSVVGRVLFPTFSQWQTDHERLANAYIRAMAAIVFITSPLLLGFFILRESFVIVALGDSWLPVANVLAWLIPVGLLQSIGTSVGTLYLATGRTDVMFKWGIGAGLLVIPAFVIGLQFGIVGVAAAYAVASLLLFYPGLAVPFRLVGLRVGDVLWRTMPSVVTAIAMALSIAVLAAAWPADAGNQLLRLMLLVLLGMVTYGGISLFTQRALMKELFRSISNK